MPMWTKAENDQRCRQFARDVSSMFKKEIEAHGNLASNGLEGGAGVRGKKGAVMLYGNYDVSNEFIGLWQYTDLKAAIRRDIKGHLRRQLRAAAEDQGAVRPEQYVQQALCDHTKALGAMINLDRTST